MNLRPCDVVTTSKSNKLNSKSRKKKNNPQSNIERRGLLFDRATESWYDKSDKYYQIKKLLNNISTNINNNKNNMPRIIIKNVDITEWSYNDIHEELEQLIHEFELIGNNHWAHLNQELLVDYKIHTPKKDNNDNNDINNKQEQTEINQRLKDNWFQELMAQTKSELATHKQEQTASTTMEIEVKSNDNTDNNNNNNHNSDDNKEDRILIGTVNGKAFYKKQHKEWNSEIIGKAREAHPTTQFNNNTRIDGQMELYCKWNPKQVVILDDIHNQIKTFDKNSLTTQKEIEIPWKEYKQQQIDTSGVTHHLTNRAVAALHHPDIIKSGNKFDLPTMAYNEYKYDRMSKSIYRNPQSDSSSLENIIRTQVHLLPP